MKTNNDKNSANNEKIVTNEQMNKWKIMRKNGHNISHFEPTNNMENRIVNVEDIPASCKEGRRIRNVMINEMMTTHCHGSKAPHRIKGRNDFEIVHMMDKHGDSPPNSKIELTQVWHGDGKNKFEVTLEREDFWF